MCFVGPCLHILCTLPAASFFVCTAHSFTKYTHTLTHTLAYTNNFFQTNTHSLDYPHTLSLLPPSVSPHAYALFIDFALRCAALHLLCSSLLTALRSLLNSSFILCTLFLNLFALCRGTLGLIVSGIAILWCAISASKLFATAFSMDHQQLLIAYPCAVLYGGFALITIY